MEIVEHNHHRAAVLQRTYDGPCPRVLDTLNPGMFLGEAR